MSELVERLKASRDEWRQVMQDGAPEDNALAAREARLLGAAIDRITALEEGLREHIRYLDTVWLSYIADERSLDEIEDRNELYSKRMALAALLEKGSTR